ncbi:hypothetical protein SAY86_011612 [Trapa natans]|uniref:RRM domain-containing protein n=1 Tax=Trapa natans TaxID=22666 RepID=A0AAN7LMJ0_TRANT|nr:hypothetical protein SAY86_011612 [Trapa natans]
MMAALADIPNEASATAATTKINNSESKPNPGDSKPDTKFNVQNLVDMFTKLNPMAKEFIPSSYSPNLDHHRQLQSGNNYLPKNLSSDDFPNNWRKRNNFNPGAKRLNGRGFRAQKEDSIRRTVYVSDIDQHVAEEQLATLFSNCGQVIDCRVCGDPHSVLRFAFVEFADEYGARVALNLGGTMLGYYPVRVLPSKTAILPSEDEREMCSRTVYCTNIDKKVSHVDVKKFFEKTCGEVTRLRLLGDQVHSTRIAFVEFAVAESAIIALNCSGMLLGTQPIRVSPSKTPVRPRVGRPSSN